MKIKKIIRIKAFNSPACITGGILIPAILSSLDFGLLHVTFFAATWIIFFFVDYQIGYVFLWIRKDVLFAKHGLKINIFHAHKARVKTVRSANSAASILIIEECRMEKIKLPFYMAEAQQEKIFGELDTFIKNNDLKYEATNL